MCYLRICGHWVNTLYTWGNIWTPGPISRHQVTFTGLYEYWVLCILSYLWSLQYSLSDRHGSWLGYSSETLTQRLRVWILLFPLSPVTPLGWCEPLLVLSGVQLIKRLECVLSCLCNWCTYKNMYGPLEHAQPPYFCLPSMIVWMSVALMADKNEVLLLHEKADLYAPNGVERRWLPSVKWNDTEW